jgi:hypothetical protein
MKTLRKQKELASTNFRCQNSITMKNKFREILIIKEILLCKV